MLTDDLIGLILKSFPRGLCAIDLETTGLSPIADKIVEVACLKIDSHGKAHKFEALINPQIEIPQKVIDIHHITNEMIKDKPSFEQVSQDLIDFLGTTPIVAHNAHYDISFLIHELLSIKKPLPEIDVFCSFHFSKNVLKQVKSHKLSSLIKHYNVTEENSHRALDDAKACLHVFAKMLEYIDGDDAPKTVGEKAFLLKTADYKNPDVWKIPKHLKLIEQVLTPRDKIEIRYMGGSLRNKWRPIIPQSFLPLPSGLILKAECLISHDIKSFIVKKIAEARRPGS